MGSPLRDMGMLMAVDEIVCPIQKKEHLTIKKKFSIVTACRYSGQGINEYVQTHNQALAPGGILLTARALGEWLNAEFTQFWKEFLVRA